MSFLWWWHFWSTAWSVKIVSIVLQPWWKSNRSTHCFRIFDSRLRIIFRSILLLQIVVFKRIAFSGFFFFLSKSWTESTNSNVTETFPSITNSIPRKRVFDTYNRIVAINLRTRIANSWHYVSYVHNAQSSSIFSYFMAKSPFQMFPFRRIKLEVST